MFQDIQAFQQLHHGVGFTIPHTHYNWTHSMRGCKPRGSWYRPWAKTQGDGYSQYDNQLFWDHGFEYGSARFENPLMGDDGWNHDHHGFVGWACNGA